MENKKVWLITGAGRGMGVDTAKAALAAGLHEKLGLKKTAVAVKNCRNIGKKDLIHNTGTPDIAVDPETYEVRIDGHLITCEPATILPLAQRYFLF